MEFTQTQFENFVRECVDVLPDEYMYESNPHDYHHIVTDQETNDSLVFLWINPRSQNAYIELDYYNDANGTDLGGSKTFNSTESLKDFLSSTDRLEDEF